MTATDQATLEQWHVQVEAGDVRLWTLDQLDAAFKAELVDETTFVLEVGKTEWMTLGTLLGGDDEPVAHPVAPVASLGLQIESYTPIAPVMFHDLGTSGPNSTAPMASDIDDESPSSFRGSRKRPVAIGFGVALVAAGIAAFAFTRGHALATDDAPAVAAVAPPPAPPPPPAPVAADPAATPESQASVAARLSHDQLLKLADADRAREAKVAAVQKSRAAASPHHAHASHSKEKNPFHNGGDKYDPLNAKL